MQHKYAVIDRMADGDRYDDPARIVSRHATHETAERAARRQGCGDRYAIIHLAPASMAEGGRLGGLTRTPAKSAAARVNGARGGRPPLVRANPASVLGSTLRIRRDWRDCYPVVERGRIVGVVAAVVQGAEREVLAGVGGGEWDEERQAFVRG